MNDRDKTKLVLIIFAWVGSFIITTSAISKMDDKAKWEAAALVFINMIVDIGMSIMVWTKI